MMGSRSTSAGRKHAIEADARVEDRVRQLVSWCQFFTSTEMLSLAVEG